MRRRHSQRTFKEEQSVYDKAELPGESVASLNHRTPESELDTSAAVSELPQTEISAEADANHIRYELDGSFQGHEVANTRPPE